jgi:hypothetical protein
LIVNHMVHCIARVGHLQVADSTDANRTNFSLRVEKQTWALSPPDSLITTTHHGTATRPASTKPPVDWVEANPKPTVGIIAALGFVTLSPTTWIREIPLENAWASATKPSKTV